MEETQDPYPFIRDPELKKWATRTRARFLKFKQTFAGYLGGTFEENEIV
jgi:hypothetical protein